MCSEISREKYPTNHGHSRRVHSELNPKPDLPLLHFSNTLNQSASKHNRKKEIKL